MGKQKGERIRVDPVFKEKLDIIKIKGHFKSIPELTKIMAEDINEVEIEKYFKKRKKEPFINW